MVGAVLRDLAEATSFLQAHLPEQLGQTLNWPTLKLVEGSFIDEDLRRSESDLLYEIEQVTSQTSLWLYLLLEHQSVPDRWIRFRLMKYCCRIWDLHLQERPMPSALRPILPLVFYQGERRWSYSTEFADLFAESARNWPWTPRFAHMLIDQSSIEPGEMQGDLKARLMQLLLLAAYHPDRPWEEFVAALLDTLSSLPPSSGIDYVRVFMIYILQTQDREAITSFQQALRHRSVQVGDDLMNYAQELLEKGRLEERLKVVENLLRLNVTWSMIEEATGVNEAQFQRLKQQLEEMDE